MHHALTTPTNVRGRERGQVVVLFALLLPVILAIGTIVVSLGNWYVHGKHLQTKADASAFAGGGAWGFPCGPDIDTKIETQARTYAGPHVKADGTPYTGTAFNNQVGGVTGSQIHVVLNGSRYYNDGNNPMPAELDSPASTSICNAKVLDVKMTEDNSFPLFRYLPFTPDINRKARVEIDEVEGLSGLLPIAVRVPKPLSAAAVFYDEKTNSILDVRYMCSSTTIGGLPSGLDGWTTLDPTNTQGAGNSSLCPSWANVNVGSNVGVAVATSFRPACDAQGATPPCLQDSGWVGAQVSTFCRQASGTVQCVDATGSGSTQNVQSGIQFIRGYSNAGGPPPPLRTAYLDGSPANCYSYFDAVSTSCSARLNVTLDLSDYTGQYPNPSPPPADITGPLRASDVQIRMRVERANGASTCATYGANCDVLPNSPNASGGSVGFSTTGSAASPHLTIPPDSWQNAISISVQLRNATGGGLPAACSNANFNPSCRWYYTGSNPPNTGAPTAAAVLADPVQRSFSGSIDRTGPFRWTRLTADTNCDSTPDLGLVETGEAASVPSGDNCFYFEMGLQGGLARDQDEPAIAFNLGTTGSQRALIDCDSTPGSNLQTEIQNGCTPQYATHPFTYTPYCPPVNSINGLLSPQPAPWDATNGWPPAGGTRCVITQTGASNQIIPGLNQRLFGVQNNPSCPADDPTKYVPGRNYWHDNNNQYDGSTFAETIPTLVHGNNLRTDDPRLVTLFFTPYDSFSSPGNEVFPIVGFGAFYITGYGRTTGGGGSWQGGSPEDPCTGGNSGNPLDGLPYGVGNEPPPDLNLGANQTWVWGHFVNPVLLTSNATPTNKQCNPGVSFQPCVAVLVE